MPEDDSIRVLIRVRPKISTEHDQRPSVVSVDEEQSAISISREKKGTSEFKFSSVLGPRSSQVDVYEKCHDILEGITNGVSACIMAYGQVTINPSFLLCLHREHCRPLLVRPIQCLGMAGRNDSSC